VLLRGGGEADLSLWLPATAMRARAAAKAKGAAATAAKAAATRDALAARARAALRAAPPSLRNRRIPYWPYCKSRTLVPGAFPASP
jgi:hypothetical protein